MQNSFLMNFLDFDFIDFFYEIPKTSSKDWNYQKLRAKNNEKDQYIHDLFREIPLRKHHD